MKKTFALTHARHKPPQALAAVKNQIRKYIKRERRKELPEGVDFWDFDCRVGADEPSASDAHITEVIGRVDGLAKEGALSVYVEIMVKNGHRTKKPKPEDAAVETDADDDPDDTEESPPVDEV